jgi:hypothetical protein
VIDTYFADSDIAKVLQLGRFNPAGWKTDAIDTQAESTKKTIVSPDLLESDIKK